MSFSEEPWGESSPAPSPQAAVTAAPVAEGLSVDSGALYERPPDRLQRSLFVKASMVETLISNVPVLSCQATNTTRRTIKNTGMVHLEGGWPSTVDVSEADERIKYAKRMQREESYLTAVSALLSRITAPLRTNAALDIYSTYFDQAVEDDEHLHQPHAPVSSTTHHSPGGASDGLLAQQGAPTSSAAATSPTGKSSYLLVRPQYSDRDKAAIVVANRLPAPPNGDPHQHAARAATSLTWMFADPARAVVAYSAPSVAGDLSDDVKDTAAAYYDTERGGLPLSWLHCDTAITATAANPKDASLIVVGTENGGVQVYDARIGGRGATAVTDSTALRPTVLSSQLHGHSGRVTAVRCLVGKALEFFSAGADGRVLYWDARNLAAPFDVTTLSLAPPQAGDGVTSPLAPGPVGVVTHSVSCLDFDPVNGASSKFLFGTSEGTVVICSKSGTRSGGGDRIAARISAHYGPVMDVSRHPHSPKIFASVGDWGFNLFSEDLRTPIARSGFNTCPLIGGKWHPIRPSVFVTVSSDGVLAVWDLLIGIAQPVMSVVVTSHGKPTHLSLRADGRMAAVTDTAGTVSLVSLPPVVSNMADKAEKVAVVQLLDHETSRERQHVAAMEAKARLAAAASTGETPGRRVAVAAPSSGGAYDAVDEGDSGVDRETTRIVATAAEEFLTRVRSSGF